MKTANLTKLTSAYDYLKEKGINTFNKDYIETVEWINNMPKNDFTRQMLKDMSFELVEVYNESAKVNPFYILKKCGYKGFRLTKSKGKFVLMYIDYNNELLKSYNQIHRVIAYSEYKEDLINQCNYIFENYEVLDCTLPYWANKPVLNKILSVLDSKGLKLPLNIALEKEHWFIIEKNQPGIYLLFDPNFNLVYLGKAKSLRDRVNSHVKGLTHTKGYYEQFSYVSLLYLDNDTYEKEADLIEKDFVRNYEPLKNVQYKFK